MTERPVAFLDFEASGLHAESYPIEVAWVAADLSAGYSACIRPTTEWFGLAWSGTSEGIHGLSLEKLQAHGEDVREVAISVSRAFERGVLTDNTTMDGLWLRRLFMAAGADVPVPASPAVKLLEAASVSQGLFSAARAMSYVLKGAGQGGLRDADRAIAALLEATGGGILLLEDHETMHCRLNEACGLVEHRALDDAMAHALSVAAVDVVTMPPDEQEAAFNTIVAKAADLMQAVQQEQAARLASAGLDVPPRPRSLYETGGVA
jgi:hypothetical protein